jgi:uncharacterized Fe-S center protein
MKTKKYFINGIILVLSIFGIYFATTSTNIEKSEGVENRNVAMSATYGSIEELKNNSQLVVKGKIIGEARENDRKLSDKTAKEIIYKVKVNKVFVNKTNKLIEKGMEIELVHTTSIILNGQEYDVVEPSIKEISNGNYILFLNEVNLENETFFVPNTPNHLYRLEGKKFQNLIKDVKLNELNEEEL